MPASEPITFADLFTHLARYRLPVVIALAATLLAVWLLGRGLGRYRRGLFARAMSVPVYAVVLPGVFVLLVQVSCLSNSLAIRARRSDNYKACTAGNMSILPRDTTP